MRAIIFFILVNNLLSIHIYKCGENFLFFWGGGLSPPKPLMSAAYDIGKVLHGCTKLHSFCYESSCCCQRL